MSTDTDTELTPSGKIKPYVKLIGTDSNIFSLLGVATKALKRAGFYEDAKELANKILGGNLETYEEALSTILEYVQDETGADNLGSDEDDVYEAEDEDEYEDYDD